MPLRWQHLEDHLVPVDLEAGRCDAEDGDLAAIVHRVDHVAEGGRRARHLQPNVEAFGHADVAHNVAQLFLRRVDHVMDRHLPRQCQPDGLMSVITTLRAPTPARPARP